MGQSGFPVPFTTYALTVRFLASNASIIKRLMPLEIKAAFWGDPRPRIKNKCITSYFCLF